MPQSAKFPRFDALLLTFAWGACLLASWGPSTVFPLDVQFLTVCLSGLWGIWRTWVLGRTLTFWRRCHHGLPRWELPPAALPLPPGGCSLGKAFRLEARHTQQLEDILRTDGSLPVDPGPRGGYPLLHAVGEADEQELGLPRDTLERHVLLTGTPGSGKTRALALLASGLIRNPGATIIIDPKGDQDLGLHCSREAAQVGKPFAIVSLAYPARSQTLNVLDTATDPAQVATRIHALMPSAGGRANEPFFEQYALALIERIAHAQQALGRPWTLAGLYAPAVHRRHLEQLIFDYLVFLGHPPEDGRGSPLHRATRHYHQHGPASPLADDLLDDLEKPRDHFVKVTATLIPTFRGIIGTPLERLVSSLPPDLTWPAMVAQEMVVYVQLGSLLYEDNANRIGRVIIQDLIGFLGQRYHYEPDLQHALPITVIVDELYEVLYPQFTTALAESRGAKCSWILAQQSLAHTAAKLGRDTARVLLDNCTTRLYFQLADKETAEDVSESLGTCLIEVPKRPEPRTSYGGVGGLSGSTGKGFELHKSPLMRPEWLYALPVGEYVGRVGGVPVKGRIPLLTSRPQVPFLPNPEKEIDRCNDVELLSS